MLETTTRLSNPKAQIAFAPKYSRPGCASANPTTPLTAQPFLNVEKQQSQWTGKITSASLRPAAA
jgi:hypothetical protein